MKKLNIYLKGSSASYSLFKVVEGKDLATTVSFGVIMIKDISEDAYVFVGSISDFMIIKD